MWPQPSTISGKWDAYLDAEAYHRFALPTSTSRNLQRKVILACVFLAKAQDMFPKSMTLPLWMNGHDFSPGVTPSRFYLLAGRQRVDDARSA
jgi:hypothetical protein